MLSQPEITNMEYHGKGFVCFPLIFCSYAVAGSEHRQGMPLPAGDHRGVSPSITGSRKTRCPPLHPEGQVAELSFLFAPSHLRMTWFLKCKDMMLHTVVWVQAFAVDLGVSKLCCVAVPLLLPFLCVAFLLSIQAGTKKELISSSPNYRKTARNCRPHPHWSEGLYHITERVPTPEILLSKFMTKKISRRWFRDTNIFLLHQDTRQSEAAVRLKNLHPFTLEVCCKAA